MPDITPEEMERYEAARRIDRALSTPTLASQEIRPLSTRLADVEAELRMMKTAGIIEVAVRNPSVSEYMAHWENRAEAAEARIEELEHKLAKAMKALAQIGKTYTADKNRLIHGDLWIIETVQTTLAEMKEEDRG
jgi:chromosome segregation ATPase